MSLIDGACLGAAGGDDAQGDIAGAARDIEQREGAVLGRIDGGHQRILPGPMQAERHQVVHQVVAVRDAVKDPVDEILLVVQRHAPVAEMCRLCHQLHLACEP